MTVSYQGSITLGQAIPAAQTAQVTLTSSLGAALPDVQARVTGLLALSVQPPPSLPALISGVQATLAALQALVADPLPDVGATAAALADLQATLGQLQAGLSFAASLGGLLGTPGIHYYVFAGRADALGGEMSAELSSGLPGGGGPAESIGGAVLLARDGSARSALQAVFG